MGLQSPYYRARLSNLEYGEDLVGFGVAIVTLGGFQAPAVQFRIEGAHLWVLA